MSLREAPGELNARYLVLSALLFGVELFLALYVRDRLIRPFVGDVLVIVLIYSLIRIFWKTRPGPLALGVLALGCTVEVLQYFDYVALLGMQDNRVLSILLGRTFAWLDFLAYFAGFLLILALESPKSPWSAPGRHKSTTTG